MPILLFSHSLNTLAVLTYLNGPMLFRFIFLLSGNYVNFELCARYCGVVMRIHRRLYAYSICHYSYLVSSIIVPCVQLMYCCYFLLSIKLHTSTKNIILSTKESIPIDSLLVPKTMDNSLVNNI